MQPQQTRAKRVVIYARCSTYYHQDPEVQLRQLRLYCESRGWSLVKEVVDHGYSGATDRRPGLNELLSLARRRDVDVVCVVKLDRIFRSLKNLLAILTELEELNCQFVSISDQIDLTTATGRLHVQLLGAFAQFERDLIRDRTMAGIAHARSKGRQLGRPSLKLDEKIVSLRSQGYSYKDIQKTLGCSAGVITRAIRHTPKSPGDSAPPNTGIRSENKGHK